MYSKKKKIKSTQIGKTINELRKNKNKEIGEKAAKLLEKWRNQFQTKTSQSLKTDNFSLQSPVLKKITTPTKVNPPTQNKAPVKRVSKKPPEIPKITGDSRRDKVVHQFKQSLDLYGQQNEDKKEDYDTSEKSKELEEFLFQKYGLVDDYFKKFRTLLSNLKENGELRENLLFNKLSCQEVLEKDENELLSESEKKKREDYYNYTLKASHTSIGENRIITNMYKCHKCGNRNISYTQIQIRSADEPMTVFYNCLTCGASWRG